MEEFRDPDRHWHIPCWLFPYIYPTDSEGTIPLYSVKLCGAQVPQGTLSTLERNVSVTKDFNWCVPSPIKIVVRINGHPAVALLDTRSLANFISTNLAEQLNVTKVVLTKPLTIQLAVQGSRSKINYGAEVFFKYQGIHTTQYFDIINLQNYDLILGTPFFYQHQVTVRFNEARVVTRSPSPRPIKGAQVQTIASWSAEIEEVSLERAREKLRELSKPLCTEASETELPPLRAINHTIPLIDVNKIYPWRPSCCPKVFRPQWTDKQNTYIQTRRWKVTSIGNTVPMLLIPKPGTKKLRTVVDLHEQNKNMHKLSAPLPNIDGILQHVSKGRYHSIIDGQDAYEKIHIVFEHVDQSAVTTSNGKHAWHHYSDR